MELAYDPHRIRTLVSRVLECIDAVGRCVTDDPAAATAERALRLTRRNLEDQWMPVLRAIEQSTGMVSWTATGPASSGPAPSARRLGELLARRPWFDDVAAMLHAGLAAQQMQAMLGDPQACLDVLTDRASLFMLAEWDALPDDLVEAFVSTALLAAVAAEPGRLPEGFDVLRQLTIFSNGALDDGFRPGFARGVAMSMAIYLPTLGAGIRQSGDSPVYAIDEDTGTDILLGTHDDLVDLMGALLRDEQSQAIMGTLIGAYAVHVVDELGTDLTQRSGLEDVAAVTNLVADAAVAEQAELIAAAAEQETRRRLLGEGAKFAIGVGMSATGAGAVLSLFAQGSVTVAADWLTRVDPDRLPGDPIAPRVYDIVTVATVTMLARETPADMPADWDDVSRQLEQIDAATTPQERSHRIAHLDRWLDVNAPTVAGFLARVRAHPGVYELARPRHRRDPDEHD